MPSDDNVYPTEDNQSENQEQEVQDDEPAQSQPPPPEASNHEPIGSKANKDEKDKKSDSAEGAAEKKPKKPIVVGVIVYLVLSFIAFIFCIAGMPIGMFESRTDDSCISIWGYKPRCLGSWFRHIDFDDWMGSGLPCKKADSLIQGAQAFSVMCIIGGLFTVAVGLLQALNFADLAIVAVIIGSINLVATLVTWAAMTAMYWSNLCGLIIYADTHTIGAGLALFISAWCLQMVANGAMVIEIYLGHCK